MVSILSNLSFDNPTVSGLASESGGDFFIDLVWAAANNPTKRKMRAKEFFMLKNIGIYLKMNKKIGNQELYYHDNNSKRTISYSFSNSSKIMKGALYTIN
jgi:hypothetical protein